MPEFRNIPIENNLRFPDGTLDSVEFCVDGVWLKKLGESVLNNIPHIVFVPIDKTDPRAINLLKNLVGLPKEAVEFAFNHFRTSADKYSFYNNLGIESAKKGDLKSAVNWFNSAIENSNDSEEAHVNLANAYDDLGEYEKAIDVLEKLVKRNPFNPDYYVNLGVFYSNLSQKSVKNIFTSFLDEPIGSVGDHKDSSKANFLKAAYLGDEEALKALKQYGFVSNSKDQFIQELFKIANEKIDWGFLRSAIKIYEFILVVDTSNTEAQRSLNLCLEGLRDEDLEDK